MTREHDENTSPIRIVIIGGSLTVLERARELGVSVTLIHDPDAHNYRPAFAEWCDELLSLDFVRDYPTLEKMVLERHRHRPFTRVVSLDEEGLVPSARLNQLLGLGGNPLSVALVLKEKHWTRELLAAHGVSPVDHAVVDSAGALADFVRRTGRSIVKPVDGTGSVDVIAVESPHEAEQVWRTVRARGHVRMLAEEYLDGPEFSVDTYTWQGDHVVLAITRKLLRNNLEIGHSMPSDLDRGVIAEIERVVRRFLDLAGLVEGPAHTEIRLTAKGPRIVESQNRVGGSRLDHLMELSLGIDIIRTALAVPLGLAPPPRSQVAPIGAAAVRYFLPKPGRVVAVLGTEQVETNHETRLVLRVKPGDVVQEQHTSYDRNALGCWIVAAGRTEAEAIERCEEVLATVKIVTEDVGRGGGRAG